MSQCWQAGEKHKATAATREEDSQGKKGQCGSRTPKSTDDETEGPVDDLCSLKGTLEEVIEK